MGKLKTAERFRFLSMNSSLNTRIETIPISAIRDLRLKKPSFGQNIRVLDGVRGLAVLIVIASHADAFHFRAQGGIGVWLFFCLSGFLLTIPFVRNPSIVSNFGYLKSYFIRRINRVLPMYYFILTVILLFEGRELSWYVRHILLIDGDGVFWSIPQEMLFYLVLPFVTAFSWFALRGSAVATIVALTILAVLANLFFDSSWFHLRGNSKDLRFYIGVFLTGMVVCYIYHRIEGWAVLNSLRVRRILQAMAIGVLFCFVFSGDAYLGLGPLDWRHFGTFAVMCGFLIFAALFSEGLFLGRLLSSNILRTIGIVSFSMYLIHPTVITFIKMKGVEDGVGLFVAAMAITYCVSAVTYGLIERPFLHIDKK